jgi:hypothetical protein
VRFILSACAIGLLVAGCISAAQWTKGEQNSPAAYRDDLAQCQADASFGAAQDLSAMPIGPDKSSALVVQQAIRFKACMEDKGYSRIR